MIASVRRAHRTGTVLVAVLLCLFTLPATARAQQNPITIAVEAGYEGTYRIGEWFPVHVTIANTGDDITGRLEWHFPNESSGQFQHEIDLPRGSQKRVTIYAATDSFFRNGSVVLSADNVDRVQQDVRLEPISTDQLLIGVISSDPTLLNSLNGLTTSTSATASVRHMDLSALPEQPHSLRAVNVLFLHNVDTAQLSAAQRQTLNMWVRLGGQLVVSGGSNGVQTGTGIADLLPVEFTDSFSQQSLEPLSVAVSAPGLPNETTVSGVAPRPEARPLLAPAGGDALLFARQLSDGLVVCSTFDIAELRGWQGELDLWQQVLTPNTRVSLGALAREQGSNLLVEALRLPALRLLPASALLCVLGLYILAVGPLNYVLLRRLGRLEWAWVSIPLIVFGFVAGIYVTGRTLRGNEIQASQVTIVHGFEDSNEGVFTTYNGLFSPSRSRYTFHFAPQTLAMELDSFNGLTAEGVVVTGDAGVEIRDTLVDIGGIRTVLSESTGETGIAVSSELTTDTTGARGTVRYTGGPVLEDAIVVRGRAYQSLGTLNPGGSGEFELPSDVSQFPWSLGLDEQAGIDRQQLLGRLSDISEFNQSFIDPNGVYLIGWRNEPGSELQVNNRAVTPQGVTLYVIRLNSR